MAGKQPKGWHHEDIKAALRKRHRTLEAFSRSLGLHGSAVRVALSPGGYWPKLETIIAEELGQPPHELWPEKWNPDGTRRPPPIARDDSPSVEPPHSKKEEAA